MGTDVDEKQMEQQTRPDSQQLRMSRSQQHFGIIRNRSRMEHHMRESAMSVRSASS